MIDLQFKNPCESARSASSACHSPILPSLLSACRLGGEHFQPLEKNLSRPAFRLPRRLKVPSRPAFHVPRRLKMPSRPAFQASRHSKVLSRPAFQASRRLKVLSRPAFHVPRGAQSISTPRRGFRATRKASRPLAAGPSRPSRTSLAASRQLPSSVCHPS